MTWCDPSEGGSWSFIRTYVINEIKREKIQQGYHEFTIAASRLDSCRPTTCSIFRKRRTDASSECAAIHLVQALAEWTINRYSRHHRNARPSPRNCLLLCSNRARAAEKRRGAARRLPRDTATYRAGMDPSRNTDLTQWPPSGMRSAAALLHDEMQSYARVKALPL